MSVNSKDKGARFERKLASIFRSYGFKDCRRSAQYCGNTGDAADVVNLPLIHVEAKHCEAMRLYDWMAQAKRDAEAGGKGYLDDWMTVYREFCAGNRGDENRNEGNLGECAESGL